MNKPWKEVTIYDIAEKLALSASTVSRALNNHPIISEKTRNLVKATAEEMHFEFTLPPKSAGTLMQATIGLVVPFINQENMADVVAGILDSATRLNFNIILSQSSGILKNEEKAVKELLRKKIDGLLICLASEKDEMKHLDRYQKNKVPVCTFHKVWNHPYSSQVKINNHKAAYDLTKHLILEGCNRIVHVTHHTIHAIYHERLEGYKAALADHGIAFDDNLVIKCALNVDAGKKVALQILNWPKLPDGIMVTEDTCAVSCMNTLREKGINIPADIAITGFNNDLAGSLAYPALTTVDFQAYQMGQIALSQLVNQIVYKNNSKLSPFRVSLECTLLPRASTLRNQIRKSIEQDSVLSAVRYR